MRDVLTGDSRQWGKLSTYQVQKMLPLMKSQFKLILQPGVQVDRRQTGMIDSEGPLDGFHKLT
jgi:hypothetical protein